MSSTRPSTLPKTTCYICTKAYVHSGNYIRHVKTKRPEQVTEILGYEGAELEFSYVRLIHAEEENVDEGKYNNGEERETDIGDGPPVCTPILVDTIESHDDGPQPMHSHVDIEVGGRQPSCRNPYTPFLDVDELEFAFRLKKHGISKTAVDDIMSLRTIRSSLPNGHFKSAHTLAKKVENIEPDGLRKQ